MSAAPQFFYSCDWGTTSFRLRLVALPEVRIVGELREKAGVRTVNETLRARGTGVSSVERAAFFSSFLAARLETLAAQGGVSGSVFPVLISGMASSSVGWKELPYAETPFPLDGSRAVLERIPFEDSGGRAWPVHLVSGVRDAADILRGEETEALGLFQTAERRALAGNCLLLLPGTHSKHLLIRDGAIGRFHTYMTGELYEVLATHSLLRFSLPPPEATADPAPPSEAAIAGFQAGVRFAREHGWGQGLFQVRSRHILIQTPAEENAGFLGGLLIGGEIQDRLARSAGMPWLLAAGGRVARFYRLAIETLGADQQLEVSPLEEVENACVAGQARLIRSLNYAL